VLAVPPDGHVILGNEGGHCYSWRGTTFTSTN